MSSSTLKSSLSKEIDPFIKQLTVKKDGEKTPPINSLIAGITTDKETLYLNGYGTRNIKTEEPLDIDDRFCFFSCSKSITAMAVLTLYEQGKFDLDTPVKNYLPLIGTIGLIEPDSVDDDDGSFVIPPKEPKNPVTARQLLLHTAGFSYVFLNYDYFKLHTLKNSHINAINVTKEYFSTEKTPLVHEPGTEWMYGHNIDWLGLVVEEITGKKLGEYIEEVIFKPIGMTSCTFHVKDDSNLIKLHMRRSDKSLKLTPLRVELDPEIDMGGQGVFGNVRDYLKFMRVWLNYGKSPDTGAQILKEETVKFAIKNHLPDEVEMEFPALSTKLLESDSDFIPEGFTLSGNAYVSNDLPTGRSKESIYWSGMANLYYWIDFKNKLAGFYACQIFPFLDPICYDNYIKFETLAYKLLKNPNSKL
ncbi:1,4-butanediol diacrylate esterase [Scheffersomyces coipomensis]|uniref:1,4-butanediol diacrylate esterase n=1 Tax=Scheffersomyces coipomensis TaxID=1788519 RepID=UPI00315CAC69